MAAYGRLSILPRNMSKIDKLSLNNKARDLSIVNDKDIDSDCSKRVHPGLLDSFQFCGENYQCDGKTHKTTCER
jgi:hypothetical protein